MKKQNAFTLIEFVMVIVITGVLSFAVLNTFTLPFHAFEDQSRRAELVKLAEAALTQMTRDIRSAVPNSVRVVQSGSVYSLELLRSPVGGRYRYVDDTTDTINDALSPSNSDSAFNVLGSVGSPVAGSRIVINSNNTSALYSAAASGSGGIITPSSTTLTITPAGSEQNIALSSAYQFDGVGLGSPRKRFYVTDTPVTYRCNPSTNDVQRYVNYSVNAVASTAIPGGADADLLVNAVTNCAFSYNAGSSARAGLVTLSLTLTRAKTYSTAAVQDTESINLIHQVHVNNAP